MEKRKIKKTQNKKRWEQDVGVHLPGFLVIPVHIKAGKYLLSGVS